MWARKSVRTRGHAALVGVLALVLAAVGAAPSSAAVVVEVAHGRTILADDPPADATEVGMVFDCRELDKTALDYAVTMGYCSSESDEVGPRNTRYGNCGSSWIYIEQGTASKARFRYGFSSSKGAVIARNLAVGYVGGNGQPGGFNDSGVMASSSYQRTTSNITVGRGYLTAQMGGTVTLFWGAKCTLLNPSDGEWIN